MMYQLGVDMDACPHPLQNNEIFPWKVPFEEYQRLAFSQHEYPSIINDTQFSSEKQKQKQKQMRERQNVYILLN